MAFPNNPRVNQIHGVDNKFVYYYQNRIWQRCELNKPYYKLYDIGRVTSPSYANNFPKEDMLSRGVAIPAGARAKITWNFKWQTGSFIDLNSASLWTLWFEFYNDQNQKFTEQTFFKGVWDAYPTGRGGFVGEVPTITGTWITDIFSQSVRYFRLRYEHLIGYTSDDWRSVATDVKIVQS